MSHLSSAGFWDVFQPFIVTDVLSDKASVQLEANLYCAAKCLSVVLMDYSECQAQNNQHEMWTVPPPPSPPTHHLQVLTVM